jgi:hypothetical protein
MEKVIAKVMLNKYGMGDVRVEWVILFQGE